MGHFAISSMDERQKPVAGVEVARTVIQEESKKGEGLRRSKRVEMQCLLAASVKKQKKSDNNCSTGDCMWCKLGVFEEKTGFSGQLKAAKERLRQVFHEKVEKIKESRDVQESFSILERFGSKVSRRYRHYCLLKAINNLLGESVFSADELKLHQDQESAYGNFRFGDLQSAMELSNLEMVRRKDLEKLGIRRGLEAQENGLFLVGITCRGRGLKHALGFDANEGHYIDQSQMCPIAKKSLFKHFEFNKLQRVFEVRQFK